MPGREILVLKAHKALPRRRDHLSAVHPSAAEHPLPGTKPQTHTVSNGGSRKITTVISTALTSTGQSPSLPLTPPSNSHETSLEDASTERPATKTQGFNGRACEDPGVSTPVNQRSPPTPDITPPSAQPDTMLQLRHTQPIPSSRTESFRTAREDQCSSDEEGQKPESPSVLAIRQKSLEPTRPARLREVGLGLGLEFDQEEAKTPTRRTPGKDLVAGEFVAFDGAWGSVGDELNDLSDREWDTNLAKTVTVRKRPQKQPWTYPQVPSNFGTANDTEAAIPSLLRGLSLRDRIQIKRHSPASTSTEKFAEEIEWPFLHDDFGLPNKLRDVENRRLSTMSATSTIVEAMVVDTPPQRRRTLRHTGKILALTSSGSPVQRSNRSSMVSNEQSHRLVHRNVKIPERGNRNSFASDTSASAASTSARPGRESIPVVVIPERRSSLTSSAASSRRPSRSLSLTSARQQLQPATAPGERTGYFDIPRQRDRTLSDSLPSSTNSRYEGRRARDFSPVIPHRSSSLSAPTSRNASRATSLTSASLKLRNAVPDQEASLPQPALQITRPSGRLNASSDRTIGGEWSSLRPQSALITPFSQHSVQSSTPGTLEVSEATAISIYPHNNKSILVVQQRARRDSQQPELSRVASGQIDETVELVTDELTNPQIGHQSRCQVDSPLKNPREPPKPPEFKVIPPTPVVLTPASESNRQLGMRPSTSDGNHHVNGPLSLVKRALSTRRYSESFISPFSRSLTQRGTTIKRRPSVGEDTDSKLHPFWRPRGFWDDLSDSDSDFGNDGFLISNSLDVPQRRVVRGPSSLARRLTGFSTTRKSRDHGVRRKQSYDSLRGQRLERGKRVHTAPGLGLHMQSIGWKSLQDRLEKRKEQKEESRREKERAKLRKSIGAMIVQPDARVA